MDISYFGKNISDGSFTIPIVNKSYFTKFYVNLLSNISDPVSTLKVDIPGAVHYTPSTVLSLATSGNKVDFIGAIIGVAVGSPLQLTFTVTGSAGSYTAYI